MPWKTIRKNTPCGWEEEEVWVDEDEEPIEAPEIFIKREEPAELPA